MRPVHHHRQPLVCYYKATLRREKEKGKEYTRNISKQIIHNPYAHILPQVECLEPVVFLLFFCVCVSFRFLYLSFFLVICLQLLCLQLSYITPSKQSSMLNAQRFRYLHWRCHLFRSVCAFCSYLFSSNLPFCVKISLVTVDQCFVFVSEPFRNNLKNIKIKVYTPLSQNSYRYHRFPVTTLTSKCVFFVP